MAEKIIAKKYFETVSFKYYRTESGHTFAIYNSDFVEYLHYYGNVKGNEKMHTILTDEQKKELFSRVEFVD